MNERTVSRLTENLRSTLRECLHHDIDPYGDGEWYPLPDHISVERIPGIGRCREVVRELDRVLAKERFDADLARYPLNEGERWSLGSAKLHYLIRAILRGYVEPVLRLPVVDQVPARVVAYFIGIPNDSDLLKRENHDQFGWHYHYLNSLRQRSDTVLCWDTRANGSNSSRPLFYETHAEKRARFHARPARWVDEKRSSIRNACAPDLSSWSIGTFRSASNDALPVWPRTATLTPHPKAKR
jgi:hypothetical protein